MNDIKPSSKLRIEEKRISLSLVTVAVALLLLSLLATSTILYTTPYGIGTSPDSVAYITSARNVLGIDSLATLITSVSLQHAPFYPIVLAGSQLANADPFVGARWLNSILFGANLLLVGLILCRHSRRAWTPLLGIFLLGTSIPLLTVHAHAWSEPLFILLAFSGLTLLARALDRKRWLTLLAAAILVGLACLTRYAGLPLISTGAMHILFFGRLKPRSRICYMLLFVVSSALPLILWFLFNHLMPGEPTTRELAYHPIGKSEVWEVFYTVSGWLQIPGSVPNSLRIVVWLNLFAATLFIVQQLPVAKARSIRVMIERIPQILIMLILFTINYAGFLIVSLSFFDANTPLDDRILSPVLIISVILALLLIDRAVAVVNRPVMALLFVGMATIAIISLFNAAGWIREHRAEGIGFSSLAWQQSPLIEAVRKLPDETVIFSNVPEGIYLNSNRQAFSLPRKVNAMARRENELYTEEVAAMRQRLLLEEGIVVYFHGFEHRSLTTESELEMLGLQAIAHVPDGTIYAMQKQSATSNIYKRTSLFEVVKE